MIHAILLALGIISAPCNPYAGDGCLYGPSGGAVAGLGGNEGYGLPPPTVLSDFDKPAGFRFSAADLQAAIDRAAAAPGGGYVIMQNRLPIYIEHPIHIPAGLWRLHGGTYWSLAITD